MNNTRRTVLKASSSLTVLGLAIAAGFIQPGMALAASSWNKKAFDTKTLEALMNALGGNMPVESSKITLIAPDIAENGAVVPVSASSDLSNTTQILFLVANNPALLSAQFLLSEGTIPKVTTRVKMGKSSDVYVLVKADGKYYFAKKEVKVTLGGCGG